MATMSGPVEALTDISRVAGESLGPWLREYDGYRGTLVFSDEDAQKAHVITLWESSEAEERARASRGAMRDQLASAAGMEVVGFDVFEVVGFEVLPESDGAT